MKEDVEVNQKIEEPLRGYKSVPTQEGIGADFNFDKAFVEGLTPKEFIEDMHKRIAKWDWKK